MKKGWALSFILISFIARIAYATSFLQVYAQAARSDPVFVKAEATWQSQKMNLPIARASYLPQLTITGNGARNYSFYDPPTLTIINDYNWTYGYGLTLTQPIFALATWDSIQTANAVVKAATASYLAAQQTLMQRTAQAYFDVLKSYEVLYYTIQNKNAVWHQYVTSEKKYKAGLIAVMDMYDAESRYDQVMAQEITARNILSDKIEDLHAITGHYYKVLDGFNDQIPLMLPRPQNKDAWTQVAVKQNYTLASQRFNVVAAMEKIKQQSAGDMPTLSFTGGFSEAMAEDNSNDQSAIDNATMGLNLSYSPIQGGLVYASTKQARYNYVAASAELNNTYRQVIAQTRNSYTGVIANYDRVNVDRFRIIAANKALIATEAGLKVGARTMVDVLNALTTLYQAQQQYVDDRYSYLSDFIDLKVAAGTLTQADLVQMNRWLTRSITLPKSGMKVESQIAQPDEATTKSKLPSLLPRNKSGRSNLTAPPTTPSASTTLTPKKLPAKPIAPIQPVVTPSAAPSPQTQAPPPHPGIAPILPNLPAPEPQNLTPLPTNSDADKSPTIIPAPHRSTNANLASRILRA